MACISPTWTPSSLQLRLALNFGNHRKSQAVLVRTRVRTLDRGVRALCVANNGEERRDASSWNGSDSATDNLAGWSGSDVGEKNLKSRRSRSFEGVLGVGLAASILVAGFGFAALSLSRHKISRAKQEMEPLTSQQEVLPGSDEATPSCETKVEGNMGNNVGHRDGIVKSSTGAHWDSSAAQKYDDAPAESGNMDTDNKNKSIDYTNDALNGTDAINNFYSEEKHESALVDSPISAEVAPNGTIISETVVSSSSLAKPTSEIEENAVDSESTILSCTENLETHHKDNLPVPGYEDVSDVSPSYISYTPPTEPKASVGSHVHSISDSRFSSSENADAAASTTVEESPDLNKSAEGSMENDDSSHIEFHEIYEHVSGQVSEASADTVTEVERKGADETGKKKLVSETAFQRSYFHPSGIPAPSLASEVNPGKVLIPAVVDQVQSQAFAALHALKVIEGDAQPTDLCTRREYARWLVSASGALSRNTTSKVYPAMYIENITELAFDDIMPEDPDFQSIQGLAEAGLISSKLSDHDLLDDYQGQFFFSPESLLSRQDLISWKMALDKRQLPEADRKTLYQLSGFIDIDKIHPDAWPALIADLSAGEQGITALAFGCTRLFQPDKPVTKAQAAVALASGEAFDIVSEELARIEAETMAEKAVSAHNALVAEVEKDLNANFEKELFREREKIEAVEKMAEQARLEFEKLRAQREEENLALIKERAMIESEMEVLSRLRSDVQEQLQNLMSNKAEISYEKERINKLRKEAEDENERISRLQYELDVERKALSMARAWAEDEAKRAREQAKALKEARSRWESRGLKVVIDEGLQEDSVEEVTWLNAGKQFSVEGTAKRADSLVEKLKVMAKEVGGRSREIITTIIERIRVLISALTEQILRAARKAKELKNCAGSKAVELREAGALKLKGSAEEFQRGTAQLSAAVGNGVKRVAEDCREGVGKLSQKFKA